MASPQIWGVWLMLFMLSFYGSAQAQDRIFWTESLDNEVRSANLNGSDNFPIKNTQLGVFSNSFPVGIVADTSSGLVYYTDIQEQALVSTGIDGFGGMVLLTAANGIGSPTDLTLDLVNNKIYFLDANANSSLLGGSDLILRCDLDGANLEVVANLTNLNNGFQSPEAIQIDLANNYLYFSETNTDAIYRLDLNPSTGVVSNLTTIAAVADPIDFAIDVANGTFYVVSVTTDAVQRGNLNGVGNASLSNVIASLSNPTSVSIDVDQEQIYYLVQALGQIRRVNYDGSGDALILSGLSTGQRLTTTLEPVANSTGAPQTGQITVAKTANVNDSTSFSFSGDNGIGNFNLQAGNNQTFSSLSPGTYTITESPLSNWEVEGITILVDDNNNSSKDVVNRSVSINLDAGEEITVTFDNQQIGSLTFIKSTLPSTDNSSFGFNLSGPDSLAEAFNLSHSESRSFTERKVGEYVITEQALAGFDLKNVQIQGDTDNGSVI
ncbi:MAG: hypothetical protein AAFU60_09510, partial [Bacteroidota bacterium]